MKNTIITSILLFVLMFQLTSCIKENVKPDKKVKADSDIPMRDINDTIFDRKNVFYAYVQKNYPKELKENKLMFFKEKDIDLDGINEGIVALGQFSDDSDVALEHLFILKNDHGIIKEIICDFEKYRSFFISNVRLISLQDKKQSYLLLGGMDDGFVIFELVNNKLKEICVSPHSEYDGDYEFIDSNSDKKYEGYIHKEFNCFPIEENFVFENGVVKKTNTKVLIPPYPDNIKDILYQYIALRSLDISYVNINEVNQRLRQLCIDKNALNQKLGQSVWNQACNVYSFYNSEDEIQFNIEENGNTATASPNYTDSVNDEKYEIEFGLVKANNKWQINKVEIISNGS